MNLNPRIEPRRITAISFIKGEVIRKDIVIPRGIPALVNPKNRGILEQEQNGAIAPNPDAIKYPAHLPLFSR